MEVHYRSIKDIESLCMGLANESRLRIVFLLNELGEACVSDIRKVLRIPQPTVSRHLEILRRMALVENERRGKWIYYRLVKNQPEVVKGLLRCITNVESSRKLFRTDMQSRIDRLPQRPSARR